MAASNKTVTYADIVALTLDKIRPQIQAQISQSNAFYFHYKKNWSHMDNAVNVAHPEAAIIKPTGIVVEPEPYHIEVLDEPMIYGHLGCEHNNLSRQGDKWQCWTCKKYVAWIQPKESSVGPVEEKVSRFINLNWKDND